MSGLIAPVEEDDVCLLDDFEIGCSLGRGDVAVDDVVVTMNRDVFWSYAKAQEQRAVA